VLPVPGRLDYVQVAVRGGAVTMPWTSRDALLERLADAPPELQPIITAFRAVGASRPVELTQKEKAELLTVIDVCAHQVGGDGLPAGIRDLRDALDDELRNSG
jgi:hypothetical protein